MKRKRRVFGGAFRAKVALAAVKGDKTLARVGQPVRRASQPGLGLAEGVDRPGRRAVRGSAAAEARRRSQPREELYEQIGRLKMEVDWLKKKSAELA